jgi:hypothetical protein
MAAITAAPGMVMAAATAEVMAVMVVMVAAIIADRRRSLGSARLSARR